MTPQDLLLLIAGTEAEHGRVVPGLSAPQALPTAERLLRVLGMVPEPPRQIAASIDSATAVLPIYPADRAYARRTQ